MPYTKHNPEHNGSDMPPYPFSFTLVRYFILILLCVATSFISSTVVFNLMHPGI